MIPKDIHREHVLRALHEIQISGIPKNREPTKFNLIHEGHLFPPKLVLSVAAWIATGKELTASEFSGGDESNKFLRSLGFEIAKKRNDWTWKECFFAVWGYDQIDIDRDLPKNSLYREIAEIIDRSSKAVEYKIQNVSSYDPRPRSQKPIAEAANAQQLLKSVFDWYWKDREAARTLHYRFKEEFDFQTESIMSEISEPISYVPDMLIEEGASVSPTGKRRQRSQKLLELGRKHFRAIDAEGKLRCQVCGFSSPSNISGEIVHLHHTDPIYEANKDGRAVSLDKALKSLLPLCPTCHALAHTSRPPLNVEGIKRLVQPTEKTPAR